MTEMSPITSENLEQCIELYKNVFNGDHGMKVGHTKRLKRDLLTYYILLSFLVFYFILITI